MVMRNPWVLPFAILIMLGVLAVVIFGGEAVRPSAGPPPSTTVLRVPGQYKTIQSAVGAARPGDVIQVAAGTYNENVVLNKVVDLVGARPDALDPANNSTVLDGDNGQATLFIPGGLDQRPSISGFVIRNSQYGIEAHSQFVVEDSFFYGSQIAVRYESGSGGVNRGNVYFNSSNDAVHVDDVSLPLLIESNRFLYAGDDAIELDFPPGRAASPVVLDIFNNVLAGSSQDGLKLVDDGTAPQDANRLIIAAGNLFANNRRAGVGVMHSGNTNEDYSGADAAEAIRLYNNTFYGNDYGISGGDNLVGFNNIIANTNSRGAWRVQGPPGSNSVIAYTLFWDNGMDTDQSFVGLGNILGQDPLFAAPPSAGPDGSWGTVDDDFSGLVLRAGSPAIDRGVAQYTTVSGEKVPASPLTGFNGAAPDLGWREFGGALAATATPSPTRTFGPAVTSTAVVLPPLATLGPLGSATAAARSPTATGTPATATPPGIPSTGNGTPRATEASPTLPLGTAPSPTAPETTSAATTAAPPVAVTSISPASAAAGETLTLTIGGTGFEQGLTVSFEGGTGTPPEVIAVQVLDTTTLLVTAKALNSTPQPQIWDVRVDNPDGSSALLESAFTVTP